MPVPPQLLPRQWLIPKGVSRDRAAAQVQTFVAALDHDKGWRVTVEEYRPTRSTQQNAFLWAGCYRPIAEATGYELDEIHEWCCGLMWGWKDKIVPKTPRNPHGIESVPVRSTTRDEHGKPATLNKQEFADYIARIQRFAASKGIYIMDPDEWLTQQSAVA